VCVQNWSYCHCVAVAHGSEGWDVLDEKLSNSKWELLSCVPLIQACTYVGVLPSAESTYFQG